MFGRSNYIAYKVPPSTCQNVPRGENSIMNAAEITFLMCLWPGSSDVFCPAASHGSPVLLRPWMRRTGSLPVGSRGKAVGRCSGWSLGAALCFTPQSRVRCWFCWCAESWWGLLCRCPAEAAQGAAVSLAQRAAGGERLCLRHRGKGFRLCI